MNTLAVRPSCEPLEARRLLAAAVDRVALATVDPIAPRGDPAVVAPPPPGGPGVFDGTEGPDTIQVRLVAGEVRVTVNNVTTTVGSGLTGIELNGLGGVDAIDVDSAGSVAVTVNAGAGDDRVRVAYFTGNLDDLDAPVTVDGGADDADGDLLEFWDDLTQVSFADTYTLDGTTFGRTFFAGCTYDSVEGLEVNGQPGNNAFDVAALPDDTELTFFAADGDDTLRLAPVNRNLDTVEGPVTFVGGDDADRLELFDDNNGFGEGFTLDGGGIDRFLFGGASPSDSVEQVVLSAGSGFNDIFVRATPAGRATTVNAGGGDDRIYVGTQAGGAGNLDGVLGPVAVDGGDDDDQLFVDDDAASTGLAYLVDNASAGRTGGTAVTYGGVEGVTLDVSDGGPNDVRVASTSVPTTVDGGAADDSFQIGVPDGAGVDSLDDLDGNLTVEGQGGSDDRLLVNDLGNPFNDTLTLTAVTFDREAFPLLTYGTVEAIDLLAGAGNNGVVVDGTAAGVRTSVDAGDGVDAITVFATGALGVTVRGGDGADDLTLPSDASSPGRAYLDGPEVFDAVVVGDGKRLELAEPPLRGIVGPARYAITASSLSASPADGGLLILNDHGVIVDHTGGAAAAAAVRAAAIGARLSGSWLGTRGITTAEPADSIPQPALAVGYREATAAGTFLGSPHDATAVLVRATLLGDANLDGAVGFADLGALATAYGTSAARWDQGDFDYSGAVGFADLGALAARYGNVLPVPQARPASVARDVLS